jgi:3' terminal RNA ribose 2'-O-methyltransferase Hen1
LARARRDAIVHVLKSAGARTVVDLGTGEGQLVKALLSDPRFTEVTGADVSLRELDRAERVIGVTRLPDQVAQRLTLLQTSLTYTDDRLAGKDAAVLSEVIEHIDPDRLPAVERSVFGAGHRTVIVTTPNVEYNALYEGLAPDEPRHHDHRFEWDRRQFREWAARVGTQYGYTAEFRAIGTPSEDLGAPTQMAVFTRAEGER